MPLSSLPYVPWRCTDCGRPCGNPKDARVRCGPCQRAFDVILQAGCEARHPDAEAQVRLYERRAEAIGRPASGGSGYGTYRGLAFPAGSPSIFAPVPRVG